MDERYLSTKDFVRILNVSKSVAIKWIKSGRIVVCNVRGRWRTLTVRLKSYLRGVRNSV